MSVIEILCNGGKLSQATDLQVEDREGAKMHDQLMDEIGHLSFGEIQQNSKFKSAVETMQQYQAEMMVKYWGK